MYLLKFIYVLIKVFVNSIFFIKNVIENFLNNIYFFLHILFVLQNKNLNGLGIPITLGRFFLSKSFQLTLFHYI
jgi:hypothetical protein